jgi:heterodisulfide reductase subunit C/nitrate reductase gamma subunit
MLLTYCAYISLVVCIAGTLWRVGRWFLLAIGPETDPATPGPRLAAMLTALPKMVFGRNKGVVLKALVMDVLLQRRIFRQSVTRWVMHIGICYGVLLLVLVHALDDLILPSLVNDYAATRNPYLFLRNLLGLAALLGLMIAVVRRYRLAFLKRFNTVSDRIVLVLIAAIIVSGIGLEASQIISAPLFEEMVADYWGSDDPREVAALKAYWADQYHVVFPTPPSVDLSRLEAGRQFHEEFCAACHSDVRSAFVSLSLAKAIAPMAGMLDRLRIDMWLWHFHYLTSCLALALLPFGKLFHLLTVPLSLALHSLGPAADQGPEARVLRRAIGLDACTHCGICSRHCSVAPIAAIIPNAAILPSEKIGEVGRLACKRLTVQQQWRLSQGSHICTACGRCTDLCPSGIDLQDLWSASTADLDRNGYTAAHGWIRSRSAQQWADDARMESLKSKSVDRQTEVLRFTGSPDVFWACVQCTTCTSVCPVVAASEDPRRDLDMTPQQVMNLMRLELKEMALGCRMVWDCVTCYKCQEYCPQGVPVADVLYELRNEACRRLDPSMSMKAGTMA